MASTEKNLNTIFFHLWLCVSNVISNWVSLSTNNDNRYVFLCNASHENKVKHQIKITRFQERNNNNVFKTKKQNKVFLMNYELFIYYFLCIFFFFHFFFCFLFSLMVIFPVSFIWFLSFLYSVILMHPLSSCGFCLKTDFPSWHDNTRHATPRHYTNI